MRVDKQVGGKSSAGQGTPHRALIKLNDAPYFAVTPVGRLGKGLKGCQERYDERQKDADTKHGSFRSYGL